MMIQPNCLWPDTTRKVSGSHRYTQGHRFSQILSDHNFKVALPSRGMVSLCQGDQKM